MAAASAPLGRDSAHQRHDRGAGEPFSRDQLECHDTMLRSYLRRRLQADEDERDYVQEVYLRVLAMRREERESVSNWRGFMVRIAANLMIDRSRRRRARQGDSRVDIDQALAIADDHAFDGERIILARERVGQVDRTLAALDHAARHALVAARVHGLSHAEIAAELGVSTKNVSRLIERALYALARDIAKQNDCDT